MKKVLIVTYYWPPSGGVVVQRWLKFVKYLRSFGWEPVIYTVENPHYPFLDEALEAQVPEGLEIIKTRIWEPFEAYARLTGRKKGEALSTSFASEKSRDSIMEKLANYVRSNFFIPDARKYWIKPSVRFLKNYLQANPVDVLVTTGPPHSLHLIGLGLKKKTGMPWVADFRDPWTGIDYYDELRITDWADRKHRKLEKAVLSSADLVLGVSRFNVEEFVEKGAKRAKVITNGFDDDDFSEVPVDVSGGFVMSHIGSFMANRNPHGLWKALADLVGEHKDFATDFKLRLVGKVDRKILDSIEDHGLSNNLERIDFMPHKQALVEMKRSPALLLVSNKTGNPRGMMTGKFLEYLGSGRPIMGIGPVDGDVAGILAETGQGKICGHDDVNGIKEAIFGLYQKFSRGELESIKGDKSKYSRKNLTAQLSEELNQLI